MSHSVERHLAVAPAEYDAEIRRFVPGYEQALDELCSVLVQLRGVDAACDILDLGAGTGALSARIAARLPAARLIMLDADAAMLEQAAQRLAPYGARTRLHHGSFAEALPRCDLAVASLALHHVHEPAAKQAVYRNIHGALADGGALLSADAFIPRAPALAEAAYARWADHLVAHGDSRAQAFQRFADWAHEDRYFALDDELDLLRAAGFASVDVAWRSGPIGVVVALR